MSQNKKFSVSYSLDKDDFLTFQLYVATYSKPINKRRRMNLLIPIPVYLLVGVIMYMQSKSFSALTAFIIFSILWVLIYPRYVSKLYKRQFSKYIQKRYETRFGNENELAFYEDRIDIVDKKNKSKVKYTQVMDIIEISTHYFIGLASGQGIIVPKTKIPEEELKKIIRFLEEKLDLKTNIQLNWKWR